MTRAEIATVTMRFEEAVEQTVGRSLEEIVTEYLDENLCLAHHKLDMVFGNKATITPENVAAVLKADIGLPDSVTVEIDYDFAGSKYGSEGDGNTAWLDGIETVFTDTLTGDTYSVAIDYSMKKCLSAPAIGFPAGARGICPEDWDKTFHDAQNKLDEIEGSEENPFRYEGVFSEIGLENFFREQTGLSDKSKYDFFVIGLDPEKAEDGCEIDVVFRNRDGIPDNVLDYIKLNVVIIGSVSQVDIMNAAIEAFLEEYRCVAHNKIHLTFPLASRLKSDFPVVILDAMGLDSEKYELIEDAFGLDDLYDSFAGQGDGNSGAGEVTLSVRCKETGEESDEYDVEFYASKMVDSGFSSLLMCADDSDLYDEGERKIEKYLCEKKDAHPEIEDLWTSNEIYHMIFRSSEEYSEASVKALLLKTAGVDDSYEVKFWDFNPDITERQLFRVRIYKWYGKVLDMSHEFCISPYIDGSAPVGGAFTKTHPTDPMYDLYDQIDMIIPTDDNFRLALVFQTASSVTFESFNSQIINGLGLNPNVYEVVLEDQEDEIEAMREIHQGLTHAQQWAYGPVNIALKNKKTNEVTEFCEYSIQGTKDLTEYNNAQIPVEDSFTYNVKTEGAIENEKKFNEWLSNTIREHNGWDEEWWEAEAADFAAVKAAYDGMVSAGDNEGLFDFPVVVVNLIPAMYNQAHFDPGRFDRTYTLTIVIPNE